VIVMAEWLRTGGAEGSGAKKGGYGYRSI